MTQLRNLGGKFAVAISEPTKARIIAMIQSAEPRHTFMEIAEICGVSLHTVSQMNKRIGNPPRVSGRPRNPSNQYIAAAKKPKRPPLPPKTPREIELRWSAHTLSGWPNVRRQSY